MYKTLLVDDERIIREGIAQSVKWLDYGCALVGTARNGLEAYELIRESPPAIVITDIKMPGLDGLALIKRVKQEFPKIEFIILSGYGEFEFAKQAMSYGVRHYILKPCNEQKISEALGTVVKELEQRTSRELYLTRMIDDFNKANYESMSNLVKRGNREEVQLQINDYFQRLDNVVADLGEAKNSGLGLCKAIIQASPADQRAEFIEKLNVFAEMETLEQIRHGLLAIADEITKVYEEEQRRQPNKWIHQVLELIEDNLDQEELSLKWLAQELLFMNPDYLGKLFKREMQEKFSDYLLRVRMEKAIKLVTTTNFRIGEIAEKVGFGDNSQYFSQVFKKYTGDAPREYRNKKT